MISNHRPTMMPRGLRGGLISLTVLIACGSLLVVPTAHAGLLDKFKEAAKALQHIKHALGHQTTVAKPVGVKPASEASAAQSAAQATAMSGSTAKTGNAPTVTSASASTMTYTINLKIGTATVTGTITTDGKQGALTQSDLLGYDLKFSNPHDNYYYDANSTKEPGFWCGKRGCGIIANSNSLAAGRGSVTFGKPAACCDHMTFQGIPNGNHTKILYIVAAGNFSTYHNLEDARRRLENMPFVLAVPSSASAPHSKGAVALVQKFVSVIPSFPGVSGDILGERLGMTLSEAEGIAEKTYSNKPAVDEVTFSMTHKEVTVTSRPFVQYVEYTNKSPGTSDQLLLGFDSPVGGGRVVSMDRLINFQPHAADDPLVSAIVASLIKKYGPPSARNYLKGVFDVYYWAFTQKSRAHCPAGECMNTYNADYGWGAPTVRGLMTRLISGGSIDLNDISLGLLRRKSNCGNVMGYPHNLLDIYAYISANSVDSTKASQMKIYIFEAQPCLDDLIDAKKEMTAAAIKAYNSVSKAPAAPKL